MLEFLRPSVEYVDGDALSGAAFLSARIAVSSDAAIIAQVPFAREEGRGVPASSTVGNVYIGIESRPRSAPIFWELGVRLPLTSEKEPGAVITGRYADFARSDAFLPRYVSVQTAFNVGEITSSGVEYRLRLSPVLDVPTDSRYGTYGFMVHSWQIGYQGSVVRLGTALAGRTQLNGRGINLGARSTNQLEVHADFLPGSIRPGLDLHLPLGFTANTVPVVVGASVSWSR
jgi:hypothetical protein